MTKINIIKKVHHKGFNNMFIKGIQNIDKKNFVKKILKKIKQQTNENLNFPYLSEIENSLKKYLNINNIIWLKHGTDVGTDGHIDNIACFVDQTKVLALSCKDKEDSFYDKINENLEILKSSVDAYGQQLEIIEMEMSYKRLIPNNDEPSSYINFYIANDAVVMPSFEDEKADENAQNIIKSLFPKRKIQPINGVDISLGGGNIHCITQQQPISKKK